MYFFGNKLGWHLVYEDEVVQGNIQLGSGIRHVGLGSVTVECRVVACNVCALCCCLLFYLITITGVYLVQV